MVSRGDFPVLLLHGYISASEQLALLRRIGGRGRQHVTHLIEKIVEVTKLFVHAGEADVSDLVEVFDGVVVKVAGGRAWEPLLTNKEAEK